MTDEVEIIPLRGVDARFAPARWAFAEEQAADIDRLWAEATARKPGLFNGQVLMQHRWRISDGVYEADYDLVSYASFVAWPQLGRPGPPRRNGFAMAALRATDGPFLLGAMGPRTYHAGLAYFPAGTPDASDIRDDGTIDLAGSMKRELMEETGLEASEFVTAEGWMVAIHEHRAAFLKEARLAYGAAEARRIMLERIRAQVDPELADIRIVRSVADLDRAVPPFAAAYIRAAFARDGA